MLDENELPTQSESMALTQMNNLNEEDLERGLMPNDVEELENIEEEDNYLRGLKNSGIKKYFNKRTAKVLWAYVSLLWLAIFDEGTDGYGAYVHFW